MCWLLLCPVNMCRFLKHNQSPSCHFYTSAAIDTLQDANEVENKVMERYAMSVLVGRVLGGVARLISRSSTSEYN